DEVIRKWLGSSPAGSCGRSGLNGNSRCQSAAGSGVSGFPSDIRSTSWVRRAEPQNAGTLYPGVGPRPDRRCIIARLIAAPACTKPSPEPSPAPPTPRYIFAVPPPRSASAMARPELQLAQTTAGEIHASLHAHGCVLLRAAIAVETIDRHRRAMDD